MKYEVVLGAVREGVEDLRSRGIIVKSLDDALTQLESHAKNLAAVEHSLEAIREEVLAPVVTELEQNKRAGKFSILGLYVGLTSMLLSIVLTIGPWVYSRLTSTLTSLVSPTSAVAPGGSEPGDCAALAKQVERLVIQLAGIPDTYVPRVGEIEARRYERIALLKSDSGEIRLELQDVDELTAGTTTLPAAGFDMLLDNRQMGQTAVDSLFRVERLASSAYALSEEARYLRPIGQLWLAEGDVLVYRDQARWVAARVFRTKSRVLAVADSKNAVLLRPASASDLATHSTAVPAVKQ